MNVYLSTGEAVVSFSMCLQVIKVCANKVSMFELVFKLRSNQTRRAVEQFEKMENTISNSW